jgi:Protein of unknown function (DUF2630)
MKNQGGNDVDNEDILQRIQSLVDEEHQLRADQVGTRRDTDSIGLADDRLARLRRVEQDLDQCWDLLRQRRAKQVAGEDPASATPRSVGDVEGYRQ